MKSVAQVTVIIPIGPKHEAISRRAVASAHAQTAQPVIIAAHDTDARGPAYVRNVALTQVQTPFVVFLDADDELHHTFIEYTLDVWRAGYYVYSDWYIDGKHVIAPDNPWCGGKWHMITSLIPTPVALIGFDESLPGAEDTDFYLNITRQGVCGLHLSEPLVTYGGGGERSSLFVNGEQYQPVMNMLMERYGGEKNMCCGDDSVIADLDAVGKKQDGDVQAQAIWAGNRQVLGTISGRLYPRAGNGRMVWVDPRDVQARPDMWRMTKEVKRIDKPGLQQQRVVSGLGDIARAMFPDRQQAIPEIPRGSYTPDTQFLQAAYQQRLQRGGSVKEEPQVDVSVTTAPIFVKPDTHYDSYTDFWRLVELSGYKTIPLSALDVHSSATYIITPLNSEWETGFADSRAQIILYDLEWHQKEAVWVPGVNRVWAADKWYAKSIGAEYVPLGSHPDLATAPLEQAHHYDYDVAMLSYMGPQRRQHIYNQMETLKMRLAPNGWGEARHQMLTHTKAMVQVHQLEGFNVVSPQRMALAAAYKMPLISESLSDRGIFGYTYLLMSDYANLSQFVYEWVVRNESAILKDFGRALHQLLCVEHTFQKQIEAHV